MILSLDVNETRGTHFDLPRECDHIVERALAGNNALSKWLSGVV